MSGAPIPDFTLPYTAYAPDGENGRVSFVERPGSEGRPTPSRYFEFPQATVKNFAAEVLQGSYVPNAVAQEFFTSKNVAQIQSKLRAEVLQQSGAKHYEIGDQDTDELTMIMRGLYLQYAKNNVGDVAGQVSQLNQLVVQWCVPRILSAIDFDMYYMRDISHMPVPLARSVCLSGAGTKSLPYQLPM